MRRLSPLVVSLTLVLGCTNASGPSDPEALLEQNVALWGRTGPANYQYTMTRLCECLEMVTQPVTVVVQNREVATRTYLSGAPVDPQYDLYFTSVPGLFELIRTAIQSQAAALAVRYHDTLGYPESIQIDWVAGVADDEVSYRVTGFEALPPR